MRRDSALTRLSSITTGIGIAIMVAVGALGIYVGKALPGHHAASTAGTSAATSGNTGSGSGVSGAQSSLNPPSTATQSAPAPAPVTSGSS
jgi:hypothetical protein